MTAESPTADMVVWPETAVPFHIKYQPAAFDEIGRLAAWKDVYLLFGVPDFERRGEDISFFNSALLLGPEGTLHGEYRKIHLVPFGEMIPFEDRLSWLKRIDLGEGDFSPGKAYTVFEIDGSRFGVAICFESIYPELVRELVRRGANFVVNITNDEWFGASLGPYQHAQMAVMRAVEFRVGLARCANTGISMFVDPYGRILSRTELFKRRILTDGVAVGGRGTVYARIGRPIEVGMLLAVLGLTLLSFFMRTRRAEWV
jgi:apolipoprotein N-acyltransferase